MTHPSCHVRLVSLSISETPHSQPHETDTLIFDLRVRCDRRPDVPRNETDPKKLYYDANVYSGMIEWQPSGEQPRRFKGKEPRPVDPDVLLVKLRPGQVSGRHRYESRLIW